MKPLFADTYYWFALTNPLDTGHAKTLHYSRQATPLVTTAWVLTEFADGFSRIVNRGTFLRSLQSLRNDPFMTIVPADQTLWDRGLALYAQRPDKD